MLWMWLLFAVTDRNITVDDGNVPELPAQCAYVLVLLLPYCFLQGHIDLKNPNLYLPLYPYPYRGNALAHPS